MLLLMTYYMNTIQAADTVADAELVLDDLGLPGGLRALTDSCLVRICKIFSLQLIIFWRT